MFRSHERPATPAMCDWMPALCPNKFILNAVPIQPRPQVSLSKNSPSLRPPSGMRSAPRNAESMHTLSTAWNVKYHTSPEPTETRVLAVLRPGC